MPTNMKIRGGRCGDTKEKEGPTTDDPPGTNRDMGAGQGWKGGANGRGT